MSVYRIRPHHGLCLHFFEGKGYSDEFVENMNQIKQDLVSNPVIEITFGVDHICEKCPNRKDQMCNAQSKIEQMDLMVAELCQVHTGMQLEYAQYEQLVEERVLKVNKLDFVCSTCSWYSICSNRFVNN